VTTHILVPRGWRAGDEDRRARWCDSSIFVAIKTAFDLYFASHEQPLRRAVQAG
jgi:hypothetical protein